MFESGGNGVRRHDAEGGQGRRACACLAPPYRFVCTTDFALHEASIAQAHFCPPPQPGEGYGKRDVLRIMETHDCIIKRILYPELHSLSCD